MGISSAQDYEEHKDDLRRGGEFAVKAGRKWPVARGQQNHDGDNEDQDVAAENQDGEPPGELLLECQDEE